MAERRMWRWWISGGVAVVVLLSIPVLRGWATTVALRSLTPFVVAGGWLSDQFHLNPSNLALTRERNTLRQQVEDLTARLNEVSQQLETSSSLQSLADFSQAT